MARESGFIVRSRGPSLPRSSVWFYSRLYNER